MAEERKPEFMGARPAANVRFRVYHPPLPLEATVGGKNNLRWDGAVFHWRDYEVQRVELGVDGTMMLHSSILIERKPDLVRGGFEEGWLNLIAAVIDSDGHLRAESIVLPKEEAAEAPEGAVN